MSGVLVLIFFTPPLAEFALKFGPAEMFFVSMSGLIIIGALTGNNIYKSLFAALFGLFLGTIGLDTATATERFTFDSVNLRAGIGVVPLVLGLFCFAEMFHNIGKKPNEAIQYKDQMITRMTVMKDIIKHKFLVVKAGFIGTCIGLLPGVGTTLAVFLSYGGEAKRSSKHPETFEKGNTEGIIAAETANNATVGSALVPLLALGVPGSPTTAIIAGALIIHGIILGPDLFVNRPDVAYSFLYGMLFTVVAMTIIGAFGIKYFSYILKINIKFIIPVVLVFALFGAYSIRNSLFDVLIAIVIGILGATFKKIDVPLAPAIIGVVLGPLIETNLVRSMTIADAQQKALWQYLLSTPLSIFLLCMLFILLIAVVKMRKKTS
ncbi:tripartite tricarboxylate transporter permease [Gracilibacillus boraciitolerans]|nr:tripartite tricarboxylate transporter permease [Gracilibacillus boraciitolerans]